MPFDFKDFDKKMQYKIKSALDELTTEIDEFLENPETISIFTKKGRVYFKPEQREGLQKHAIRKKIREIYKSRGWAVIYYGHWYEHIAPWETEIISICFIKKED